MTKNTGEPRYISHYHISQMDCPSEEAMIRMKLQNIAGIDLLDFDISERALTVVHCGQEAEITSALSSLGLGAKHISTTGTSGEIPSEDPARQWRVLWIVLGINFAFFLIEMSTGLISKSMGLVADSLDMLADALVYGMSLMAVGAVVSRKKKVALFSGIIQMVLAMLGLTEVVRRFMGLEGMPHFRTMIFISLLALVANSTCLWLLQRQKSSDAHMRASVIFSANDVIINIGVITAGLLVWWSQSQVPDLVIGIIIFLIVIRGAVRILKLAK